MSITPEEIETAIISWIQTFPSIAYPFESIEDLSDANAFTQVMCEISPHTFEIANINSDASDNWALKLTNLTYLYENLERFYTMVLEKSFDKSYVDIVKISKNEEKEQLYNLAELVLGAAVQCENKEYYINSILTLDDSCQNALMYLIEKILNRCNQDQMSQSQNFGQRESILRQSITTQAKNDAPMRSLLEKLEELESENTQLGQRVNDLVQEKQELKERVTELTQELNKKIEDLNTLAISKEGVMRKLEKQEDTEDLKNEMKLKDFKIGELNNFVEDLKQKHEMEIALLQDEVEEQKRKVLQLSKVEGTMEWYKKKYEDYSKLTAQLTDMEKQIVNQRNKIDELTSYNENLIAKVKTNRDKINDEKTRNITNEIELNKKAAEIESLKSEKKKLDHRVEKLEQEIQDERSRRQEPVSASTPQDPTADRFLKYTYGQDFQEIISNLERENEKLRLRELDENNRSLVLEDADTEVLKQENEILKKKCSEIEVENERLRQLVAKSEDVKYVERITKENDNLKQEVEKVKHESAKKEKAEIVIRSGYQTPSKGIALSQTSIEEGGKVVELSEESEKLQKRIAELMEERNEVIDNEKRNKERLNEEIANLKEEISQRLTENKRLNEKMTEIQAASQSSGQFKKELEQKSGLIKELVDEIDMMKHVIEEAGEQKEEELKLAMSAIYELSIRNTDLEKEIKSLKRGFVNSANAASMDKMKMLEKNGNKRGA